MSKTEELQAYWDSPNWSQSRLKAIMGLGKGDKSDSKELFRGNIVDCAVTNTELFKTIYYVGSEKKPSDKVCEILKSVFDSRNSNLLSEERDNIINTCRILGYQNTYKEETLFNTIVKDEYYWEDLLRSEGRIVISGEEEREAFEIRKILLSHPNTKHLLESTLMAEIKFQVSLYGEIGGIPCKGLPDILIFDYGFKTIQEVDLKKTGNHRNSFNYPAKEFRYDLQKAFYKELIQINYPDWELLPGLWLVVPKDIYKPFVRECSIFDYHMGKYGGTKFKGKVVTSSGIEHETEEHIYGFLDCLEIVKQAQQLGTNDYDLEFGHTKVYKGSIWN